MSLVHDRWGKAGEQETGYKNFLNFVKHAKRASCLKHYFKNFEKHWLQILSHPTSDRLRQKVTSHVSQFIPGLALQHAAPYVLIH